MQKDVMDRNVINRKAIDNKTLQSALKVAAVVGSVLLLINQFDALFGASELRIVPAVLTYCVPFMVFLAGRVSRQK